MSIGPHRHRRKRGASSATSPHEHADASKAITQRYWRPSNRHATFPGESLDCVAGPESWRPLPLNEVRTPYLSVDESSNKGQTLAMSLLPLRGVRVVEFCQVAAGPFCGMLLADFGADVVKVEPPQGDGFRQWPPITDGYSENFASLNRGKKSIVLDLKNEADLEVARRLALDADVLVENNRPGVMQRQVAREEATAPGPNGDIFRQPVAVSAGYGGLRQCSPLGAHAAVNWAYRAPDGSAVRQALRQDQQE
jgi:hypothetical protein